MRIGLTGTARKLRGETTDAESHLWRTLRDREMNGFKFKRQAPFGPYIVDFICTEAKLIVEADGGQHAEQAEADEFRTKHFMENGYRVLRFWNNDVLLNLEGVLGTITSELVQKPPSSCPSPQGEKGRLLNGHAQTPSPLGERAGVRGSKSIPASKEKP